MSYITAIGTANPSYRFDQNTIASFMQKAMGLNEYDKRKLQTIFKASGIDYRHSVLDDYGRTDGFTFFPESNEKSPFPSTGKRLNMFKKQALPLSIKAVHNMIKQHGNFKAEEITHLIFVSCTGMYAPGIDIELVKELHLSPTVKRTCITFMGCYAAFNALKVADAFCKADNNAKVLLVCTELCSLHFQKEPTDDNLLANALFADGSASVLIEAETNTSKTFAIKHFHNDLATEGETDMAWNITDLGFQMNLSSYVPNIIRKGIKKLTQTLLTSIAKNISDIKYFVIHPGGKKILEAIENELGLDKTCNEPAYAVLRNYGNMSSPTVLFVMNEVFKTLSEKDRDEYVLSFAFGPGLTLESMLLKINIQ